MLNGRPTASTIIAFLALVVAGCSAAPPPAEGPGGASPDPGLQPGDAIRINIWRDSSVSGSYTIDDRGVLALPLLGLREVQGIQPAVLRDELLEAYGQFFQRPSMVITILRRVSVLGAVNSPGLYTVDATLSLADVLGLAGGLTPTSDPDNIRLVRGNHVLESSLDQALQIRDADVRSGDRIIVGEKSWLERNPGALIGSLIAAAAGVTVALIR